MYIEFALFFFPKQHWGECFPNFKPFLSKEFRHIIPKFTNVFLIQYIHKTFHVWNVKCAVRYIIEFHLKIKNQNLFLFSLVKCLVFFKFVLSTCTSIFLNSYIYQFSCNMFPWAFYAYIFMYAFVSNSHEAQFYVQDLGLILIHI